MTPKEQSAMEQALEALEVHQPDPEQKMVTEAIIALRKALAKQAEQEPVAFCGYCKNLPCVCPVLPMPTANATSVKSDYYQEVYNALNAQLIKNPTGNGLDQVAQNNGLVMAMNTIQHILKKEKNRG